MNFRRSFIPFRIILRKNHIWISELAGMIIIWIVLAGLIILALKISNNDSIIRKNQRAITYARSEWNSLARTIEELNEKHIIASALDSFALGRLSDSTLWTLVELVYENSNTFGYDPFLVLAVIHVESMFDPDAEGQYRDGRHSGAFGLMQLKPETARGVAGALGVPFKGKADLFNPEINIPLGVAYLTQQISQFKSLKLGILAYNQGPGTVLHTLKKKEPLSIKYYNKVLNSYYNLRKMRSVVVEDFDN